MPIFSNRELKYIYDAVYQFDGEYQIAPNGLIEKLNEWLEAQKELCHHTDTKIIHGFPQIDGTTPMWSYCNECGTKIQLENMKSIGLVMEVL